MSSIDSGHQGYIVMAAKRRFWSTEEKRSICLQASVPGVSVAQVAQRYSMNANLIFRWLRDTRFAPDGEERHDAVFLPVTVSAPLPAEMGVAADGPPTFGTAVRIELAGGHQVVAEGRFDGEALGRMLKVWQS